MDRVSGRSLAARLFGGSRARTLALLQAAWPLAVGPELARRTEVIGVDDGTLRVRVPDAGWRKVLHRMQPQILGRLRDIAGELAPRRMGFLEGGLPAGPAPTVGAAAKPEREGEPPSPALQLQAAAIPDPEIRARFLAAAGRYLARSKGQTDA